MALINSELVPRDTLGDRVADLLRRKILRGEISAGTRLVEEELATQLGTSRQPLRYAFQVLEREGLVTMNRGKGTHVATFTAETYRQLTEARAALETLASGLAARRMTEDGKSELERLATKLEAAARAGRISEFVETDMGIHRKIWELSGNEQLERILEYFVGPGMALMELHLQSSPEDLQLYLNEHIKMVAAVSSGDERVAAQTWASMHDRLGSPLEGELSAIRDETEEGAPSR